MTESEIKALIIAASAAVLGGLVLDYLRNRNQTTGAQ